VNPTKTLCSIKNKRKREDETLTWRKFSKAIKKRENEQTNI